MQRLKNIIEPKFVLMSTATTLASGLWCTATNVFSEISGSLIWAICLFLVSISAVFLQILVAVTICNENVEIMSTNSIKEGIELPSRHDSVHSELIALLQESKTKKDISSIRVICYGTSGYGRLFDNIDQYQYIKWDIMVCSPDVVFQSSDSDKKEIEKYISALTNLTYVQLARAKFLPTIRGCIVYDQDGKPVWSCLQTYSYRRGKNILNPSADYKDFYALVGRRDNATLLNTNVNIIEREYKRLGNG